MNIDNTLFIIPARGGSKGLPRKNIIPISGKPMIYHTIDAARIVTKDEYICVSTEDTEIKSIVEQIDLKVPFLRPSELATDEAGTREVILHAIDFFEREKGLIFPRICILQPTSPLRNANHIIEAFNLWSDELDMVVSVKESKANPYFNLFEEEQNGFLKKSKKGNFSRRQDVPKIWQYNGAIYIIKTDSLIKKDILTFEKVRKFEMDDVSSIDVDSPLDFELLKLEIGKFYS